MLTSASRHCKLSLAIKMATQNKQSSLMQSNKMLRTSILSMSSVIFSLFVAFIVGPTAHYDHNHHHLVEAAKLIDAHPSNINNNVSTTATSINVVTKAKQRQQQILASFATPNQAINITHVTYDPLYDTIYLGATNTIYQLNGSDLSVHLEQSTGPVFDNPSCGITECHGFEDYMKPTQDINKVLVIDYKHKKLLSCGSTKQGACRRYQLNNIAQKEDLTPMAVAANDDNSSTYAFIAPARYTYDPSLSSQATNTANNALQQQQQVLYVASTYTKVGQSRELLVPAIGTRILDDGPNLLKLYENSFLDSARIDINSHLRDYFLVNYLYGFASSNYIYFITVQKKATSRDFEELGYHTRLARICITDSSYNSYTEVDLKCVPNRRYSQASQQKQGSSYFDNHQQQRQSDMPNDYPLLQDAILVDAGSQLLQSLAQTDQLSSNFFANGGSTSIDDNKVLLGVFSSARDHTQHAGDHSALCAFSLAQIEDKFNDNIHSCYTGRMQSRNMEYIAGNVQECPKSGQGGNVVNFCHETLKINGTIPIVSEASIQYINTTLTAITATSHVNTQVNNIYSERLASELVTNLSANSSSTKKDSAIPLNSNNAFNNGASTARLHTVVFAGTSDGHIKKILLNNATNAFEFDAVQVDTDAILSDLHLHSSGNQLIAATPYRVMKVATHNCAQYSNCRECSQSRNPYCGWCLLKKSCTTKTECVSANLQAADQRHSMAQADSNQKLQPQQQQQQPKWISTESAGKCIDLQSIVPDKIPMTSTSKLDLYIDRLPKLPREHQYKCIFNRSEQTTASQTAFGLSCPLPKLMDRQRHIQIEPGRDHALVELAVRSSETNTDFLDGRITFFDCQRHTTCKDCLTTSWGCNWCSNENVCMFNTSKCDRTGQLQSQQPAIGSRQDNSLVQLLASSSVGSQPIIVGGQQQQQQFTRSPMALVASAQLGSRANQQASNTISQVHQCPTFDVGHQQDILIADGSERELSIRVKNMPQFKGAIKCVVEIENFEISLKAKIQDERVICENSNYTYNADVGLLNGQLKVIYSDNNIFIDRTNFTLYKCHHLGAYLNRPDCSLCQRIDSRFNCAWCAETCRHRSQCGLDQPDDRCPRPRIDFVHPLSGPALGGTRLTIEGSNLGQNFNEIIGRVTIGNAPCKPVEEEYRPSNRIVCITSPMSSRFNHQPIMMHSNSASSANSQLDLTSSDILVGNKAGFSLAPAKFHFKSIYLRDHQPRYGPQSGGTRLVLSGMNLDIGASVQVFLDELPCLVELNSITSEQLICRTSASRQSSRPIKNLKLIIDDAQIIKDDDVFYYTADPIIAKVNPLRAYLSGGRPINVLGANLTVVQAPKMVIHDIASGRKVNESACILQDDTRMQCPSPAVNLQMMDLEYSEQNLLGAPYDPNGQSVFASLSAIQTNRQQQQQQQVLQQDESVRFKLSFVMDNVIQSASHLQNMEIAYTSDPKLYAFSSVQYKTAQEIDEANNHLANNQKIAAAGRASEQRYQLEADTFLLPPGEPTLTLFGEHLRAAVSEYEITVTVGQDLCNLTQLTQSKLVCLMPLDHMATPTDEEGHQSQRALPLVVVRIGFNLRYELGYVQYHPLLVEQIISTIANSTSSSSSYSSSSSASLLSIEGQQQQQQSGYNLANGRRLMHPAYPHYMPRESESILHRISSFVGTLLVLVGQILIGFVLLGLAISAVQHGLRLKSKAKEDHERRLILQKVDQLERSIKGECRIASLALQGDLNELERHVNLSGIPLLNMKSYIMKVFFPGMNNHPLLLDRPTTEQNQVLIGINGQYQLNSHNSIEQSIERPLNQQHHFGTANINSSLISSRQSSSDFPMELFERLILTKPFLINFINTLERQSSFTIRDKVNVASLLMVVLMKKLDYATDVMKTLLFQLVERSVDQLNALDFCDIESDQQITENQHGAQFLDRATRKLTRRATNLLGGLPISKRQNSASSRVSELGKTVNGGGNSLMQSTSVAAQMLLARVAHKTSPLEQTINEEVADFADHQGAIAPFYHRDQQSPEQQRNGLSTLDCNTIGQTPGFNCQDYMSTTTFNHNLNYQPSMGRQNGTNGRGIRYSRAANLNWSSNSSSLSSSLSRLRQSKRRSRRAVRLDKSRQAQSMLRRTDSVVEKMLTNWLSLNMYEHFHGQAGQSLYMLAEALKCQLERGPIDAISGDAYYSLNELKLLREPNVQFEVVNLYVIVDTDILQPTNDQNNNLLLDEQRIQSHQSTDQSSSRALSSSTLPTNRRNQICNGQQLPQHYSSNVSNTFTLALRVLDCDTVSQVKAKILSALYRNSPNSSRLTCREVDLSLRQHQTQTISHGVQTLQVLPQQQQQYISVPLNDDDFSSISSFNGVRRLNTLRHYGVCDQAIVTLKRANISAPQQSAGHQQSAMLTDMLDDHYSNPYTEIQYGQSEQQQQQHQHNRLSTNKLSANNSQQLQQSQRACQLDQSRSWHLTRSGEPDRTSAHLSEHSNESSSSPASNSPSMMLLGAYHRQHQDGASNIQLHHQQVTKLQGGAQFYHPSSLSTSTSSSGNGVMDTNSTSPNSNPALVRRGQVEQHQQPHQQQLQQPIYCQIGSVSNQSQHACSTVGGLNSSAYYCQIGQSFSGNQALNQDMRQASDQFARSCKRSCDKQTAENDEYLTRMLTSKGTVQKYIDQFFKTILTVKPRQTTSSRSPIGSNAAEQTHHIYEDATFNSGVICASGMDGNATTTNRRNCAPTTACPIAVKWIFDLLDEAAIRNGISDQNVIHAWKSNAFLLRFWVNLVKNPNYILDIEKSSTLDASLSIIAQTLIDSCTIGDQKHNLEADNNRLIFAKDLPKYKDLVKRFYQDIASMRPVSDREIVEQMGSFSMMGGASATCKFDTNLALKELCVYAVNYGTELMSSLNADYNCQQLELSHQLEQCFRSFTIFEAYQ